MIFGALRRWRYSRRYPRRDFLWLALIGGSVVYVGGFHMRYCLTEGCTHPADWWFHLGADAQAAWMGSIGTLIAVWWAFVLFWLERREKEEKQRQRARPEAYLLINDLRSVKQYFNVLRLQHPQSAKIVRMSIGKGDIAPVDTSSLSTISASPTFAENFRSSEVLHLLSLLESLDRYNEAVRRQHSSADLDATAKDVRFLGSMAASNTDNLLHLLSGRYRPPRTLEAAEVDQ